MILLCKLAWRNLFRQKTRLALNLFLLVSAFCAIVFFKGFETHVLKTMQSIITTSQTGHLQIGSKKYFDQSLVNRSIEKLIANPDELILKIGKIPEVKYASGRISFFGLAGTEEKSVPARYVGFDPKIETDAQRYLVFKQGRAIANRKEALVCTGLQTALKVKIGDEITVLTQNLNGGMNAMDLHVVGIASTGFSEIDDSTIFMDKSDAQKVLDTDYLEQILVNLKNPADLKVAKGNIAALNLPNEVEIKEWRDLSDLYNQVETFYFTQNAVVQCLLILLLVLSISNTAIVSVHERLREIGTMRAMGDYESEIQKIFLLESVFLALLAISIAIPLSYFLMLLISSFHILLPLPLASEPLPLELVPTKTGYLISTLACFLSVTMAGILPAHKGSKTAIVKALLAKV